MRIWREREGGDWWSWFPCWELGFTEGIEEEDDLDPWSWLGKMDMKFFQITGSHFSAQPCPPSFVFRVSIRHAVYLRKLLIFGTASALASSPNIGPTKNSIYNLAPQIIFQRSHGNWLH